MLRSIIGWVRIEDEPWHDTMSRMRERMNRASQQFYVVPWEFLYSKNQWQYAIHVSRCQDTSWVRSICNWHPGSIVDPFMDCIPWRGVGRHRTRWDDAIASFVRSHLDDSQHWTNVVGNRALPDLRQLSDAFVVYSNIS